MIQIAENVSNHDILMQHCFSVIIRDKETIPPK